MNIFEGRDVQDIIKEIMKIIPKNEIVLINEINRYSETLWNQSPESLTGPYCWSHLIAILNRNIPIIN